MDIVTHDAAQLLPAALTTVTLLLVPGWTVARAARSTMWASLALAPALGALLVGVAEVVAHALGLAWCPWGWVVVGALTALTAAVARVLAGTGTGHALPRRAASSARPDPVLLVALAVAAVVPALVVLTTLPAAGDPPQAFDATFHLNAVAAIRDGGNASSLGGLASLYDGQAVYYPTVWHGIVALGPGSVAVATNAALLAVLAVVWPLTLAGMLLCVAQVPGVATAQGQRVRSVAVSATLVLSSGLVAFPLLLMTSLAVWPYALSVLALPAVLTLADQARRGGAAGVRERATRAALLLAAAGGVVLSHGTGLFNLVLVGAPFAGEAVAAVAHRGRRVRRRLLLVGGLAVVLLAAGAWVMRVALASVLGYHRADGGWAGAVGTLGQALADLPMYGSVPGGTVPVGLLAGVLVLGGAWFTRHDRRARPWLVMWALALVLAVLVGGPQWVGRQLGSPWYLQKARIAPLVLLPALVLVAHCLAGLVAAPPRRLLGRRRAGGAALVALLVVAVAGRVPLERELVASVSDPSRIQYGTLLTVDELTLMERAGGVLPADAVVAGAPSQGASYLWSVAGVHVVYPVRSAPGAGTAQAELVEAWPTLGRPGSTACGLLHGLGAGYYYVDTDPTASGATGGSAPLRWDAPLAEVPATGLELVDSEGGAQLWRITACP